MRRGFLHIGLVRGDMSKKEKPISRSIEIFEAEISEKSIAEAIESLSLNELSRETLEYLAAKWYLELKNTENTLRIANRLNKKVVKDFLALGTGEAGGLIEKARTFDAGNGGKRNERDATKKAKRLWKEALEKGEVVWGGKEDFINKIRKEHPDIDELSFENLSKNIFKFK